MDQTVTIEAQFDIAAVRKMVDEALDLNDNNALFAKLAEVQKVRQQINALDDQLKSVEADVKGLINAKAKALYGKDWAVVAGPGYKISRSHTGSLYEVVDIEKVDPALVNFKVTANSKAVEDYVRAKSELPDGITINQARGEQIRITIKDQNNG